MELEYVLQEVEEGMLGRLTIDVGTIWNGDYSGPKLPANSKRTEQAL